ncbi:MAG: DUF1826 domain-containing protein [Pseudomonadota bacterium]
MDGVLARELDLVVQRRRLPEPVCAEVAKLADEEQLRLVLLGTPEQIANELRQVLDDCPAFVADVRALLDRFASMADTPVARVRIERITGDACRRWHADNVVQRLLCTYVGPGTQILRLPEAAQVLAGGEPETTATAWSVGTGDVVVLPGRLHPTAMPIVHRSPPVAGTSDVRLLLVIDDGSPTA